VSARRSLETLYRLALNSVRGDHCVRRSLEQHRWARESGPLRVLAAGKAAAAMTRGALAVFGDRIRGGSAVSRDEPACELGPVELAWAGHPLPDERSLCAAKRALIEASELRADERLLVLLSGGASALWCLPVPGVSLEEKRRVTDALLRGGVAIDALNAVRKHLSQIKGGRLALAAGSPSLTLAISDVLGDRPSVIGSGPTVPDPTSFAEALAILERVAPEGELRSCLDYLSSGARGEQQETLDPNDPRAQEHEFVVVASLSLALRTLNDEAARLGFRPWELPEPILGEARSWGARLAAAARRAQRDGFDLLVAGGEPTVTVRGHGRGGRAQELALALALELPRGSGWLGLCAGTDGSDGPTDAAGAWADPAAVEGLGRAAAEAALLQNDSHTHHARAGTLFATGATGTNVTDLVLISLRPS